MVGKIFSNNKLGSILGRKRKKKGDDIASGFISEKYIIKKKTLKLISSLVEEACAKDVKNPYFMQAQLRLVERILLTELEEYVDAKDNIEDAVEILRRQMAEDVQRMQGHSWTTNTTTIGGPINTMPQPLPGGYIGVPAELTPSDPIPDGGSGSNPHPYSNIVF